MNGDWAIQVIAQEVLARAAETTGEWWEDYPEIGEHDWERVLAAVASRAVPHPVNSTFDLAYKFLEGRAEPRYSAHPGPSPRLVEPSESPGVSAVVLKAPAQENPLGAPPSRVLHVANPSCCRPCPGPFQAVPGQPCYRDGEA